ncbi:MAG: aldolase/citrate lyase family protein [Planctomycetota bacterium]
MRPSRCRRVWAEGQVAQGLLMHLPDARVAEIAASVGFDALWIDLEHSPKGEATLEVLCRSIRAGAMVGDPPDVLARPAKGEYMRMGRLLEAGAHGILYPRCESAEEAAEVVHWMKFPPVGERGFDGGNADNAYGSYPAGSYVGDANRETWLAVQVETPAGVEAAEAMAEVEHVDALFFGPGDYSCCLGKPGHVMDPEVMRGAEATAAAAHKAGKVFGSLGFSPDQVKAMRDLDARLVIAGADQGLLREALRQRLAESRSEG